MAAQTGDERIGAIASCLRGPIRLLSKRRDTPKKIPSRKGYGRYRDERCERHYEPKVGRNFELPYERKHTSGAT